MSHQLDDPDLAELAGVAESLGLLRLGAVDLGLSFDTESVPLDLC